MGESMLLSKLVALEVNLLLTVHGNLQINDSGELHFEPAFDARLVGRQAIKLSLAMIKGVRRISGGRRVVVDTDEPLVFRGSAAQQAYVILGAILDSYRAEKPVEPIFVPATLHERLWKEPGLLAVGRTGMGFGAGEETLISGAISTTWVHFDTLEKLDLDFPGIHLHAGGSQLALECPEPLTLRDLLVERWFRTANPSVRGSTWSCLAAKRNQLSVTLGHLLVNQKGLCFVSAAEEEAEVLIARRRAGILAVEEPLLATGRPEPELLLLGMDERHLVELQVMDPHLAVEALDTILSDATWFPPNEEAHELPLEAVLGPAAYASVWRGHDLLASRRKVAVAPFSGKLRLKLDEVIPPPSLPCGVRIEIANGKGRNMLTGVLTDWQAPDARRSKNLQSTERTLLMVLEDEIQPANRRQYYRLPLKDPLPSLQFTSPPPNGRVTIPPPIEVEGAMLLDLSRTGASIWLPRRPGPDMLIHFQLLVETREVPKPSGRHPEGEEPEEEPEITVESHLLTGRPLHIREVSMGKTPGWQVGVQFIDEAGHVAFDARQRAFLRHRAEERDERGY